MSPSPIILILGAGPGIGQSVTETFTAKGYKVALASRKAKGESAEGQVHFPSDLSDPKSIADLFSRVKQRLGNPSVVVYNGQCPHQTKLSTDHGADVILKRPV